MTYEDWIAQLDPDELPGQCHELALDMVDTFPELHAVCGEVLTRGGWLTHWWCVTPSGGILDPSAGQFEGGVLGYRVRQIPHSDQRFDRVG